MLYLQVRPARKNCVTKFHNNRIAALAICDANDDSDSNKRPYAYKASVCSIIVRNYTDVPGAK